MRRNTILRLQEQLRQIARYGGNMPVVTVDGIYDDDTRAAVAAFQQLFGLKPTGEPDYDTWRRLDEVYALVQEGKAPPVAIAPFSDCGVSAGPGDRSETVAMLEMMLNGLAKRYGNLPSVPVNGEYDPPTEEAVRTFQSLNGLDATGRLDKRTWNAIAHLFNSGYRREC